MGWSFRESIKILPGIRLNFSRRGVGASVGVKGLHLGFGGGRAPRVTGGIGPLHYYQSLGAKRGGHRTMPARPVRRSRVGPLTIIIALFGGLIGWMLVPPGWISSHWKATAPQLFASPQTGSTDAKATTVLPDDEPGHRSAVTPTERHPRKTEASKHKEPRTETAR